ncbi:MAG TPA: maleylpyruvate isomerase family mycothiol-dependent enzyme [Intrasporangium sp.]|uniref:maleylpyruvate isomerase family mycothiol-dependent enzyme n=1 Tax=Intrasporangium sp. TaxID=1925024 RepID=UPI002D76BB06|nr:maleylpyruvate isomerase family mycothiol-dependent enzyme [Intrasporangium sp.]HET7398443.1 maleylpyruvate isomerase family mycothiol-dependent enzyme [Intrasporangium sp.]
MRPRDVTPDLVARETERLLATAAAFSDEAVLAPSLCEGWSRAHVLTHLARNADALARVCRAGLTGSAETMYAADDVRDAEIEAGARRGATDLVEDVRAAADRLAPLLDRLGPQLEGRTVQRTPGGRAVLVARVPFLRLRELLVHHVDLDAAFTFADVPAELAELLLDHAARTLREHPEAPSVEIRTDEGDVHVIGTGTAYVTGSRAAALLWLLRRRPDGITCSTDLPDLPFGG